MEQDEDLLKFKQVLEYFVVHLNYLQSGHSESVTGYDKYIKPYIDNNTFVSAGQGWKDGSIQNQIKNWENISSHILCINVYSNFGSYKSKKCYLNWKGTGINIFSEWNDKEVFALNIGWAYWWNNPTTYSIKLHRTISELGLFSDDENNYLLREFYNSFVEEIESYNLHNSKYYRKVQEYYNRKQQELIMENNKSLLELLLKNFNIILTGAPGTGKTYLAKQIAQQMIFGEIKEEMSDDEKKLFNEHCGFVQFHPSYDYTDFVEGLRPVQNDDGTIVFERKDGVFKEFCKLAISQKQIDYGGVFNQAWDKLISDIREELSKEHLTTIGKWDFGLSSKDSLKYSSVNTPSQYNFTITKDNVYNAYCGRIARPSGQYQKDMLDIVEYLKKHYGLPEKIENRHSNCEKYIFIIDEINRGEISKIFGELFFSIDPGYRGVKGKVKTQYQNLIEEGDEFYDGFYVPDNVYIIGTMNDIDRSVESMDFAFRRRFAFKEVTAKESQGMFDSESAWGKDNEGKPLKPDINTIETIKGRMNSLNKLIWHEPIKDENDDSKSLDGLSAAYHIGASYFLKVINYKNDDGTYNYKNLWDYHLEGLLREYLRGMHDIESSMNRLKDAYCYNKDDNNN